MPGPITHIVLTEKVFNNIFPQMNKAEFYVGTSLPDIRHLGIIDRNKTHFPNITLNEILKLDSFEAGFMLHSLVDVIGENYAKEQNVPSFFSKSDSMPVARKELEDRILYHRVNNWNEIASYFDKVYAKELSLGIPKEYIERWHFIIKKQFLTEPGEETFLVATAGVGYPKERAEEVNTLIRNVQIEQFNKYLQGFYDDFENLLQNYSPTNKVVKPY